MTPKTKKFDQIKKELIRTLTSFRPNKKKVGRLRPFPFFGAIIGLVYVLFFWPEALPKMIPLGRHRFSALPPVIGFPLFSMIMGIIVGIAAGFLIRRLKNRRPILGKKSS